MIRFETSEYRRNHGAEPRGRGSWAFHLNREPHADDPAMFWAHGTFGEAKKLARAHFKRSGTVVVVWVQP